MGSECLCETVGDGARLARRAAPTSESKDVEAPEDKMDEDVKTEEQRDAESLYPVLRAVQGEA